MCQEQFVELNQLQEHKKTHTKKRKATSIPDSKMKKRGRQNHGYFHCRVCLNSFTTREELFHHKLEHMEDPTPYQLVQPHFDGEDDRMNSVLRENAGLIFTPHRFTLLSADFNFLLNLLLKRGRWFNQVYHALDLVANINDDESFKLNLSMGFILVNQDTGEHWFFVPHTNNAFFKKPIHIEHPTSWRELHTQLDKESLKACVTHHRENTKWIPLMMTNLVIHLYFLGAPTGPGTLPDYIKDYRSILGLEKDRHGTPYEDKSCGLRYLSFHLNLNNTGDGYRSLENRTKELEQQWQYHGLDLLHVPQFEDTFNISVDIFYLCEDGAVVPHYLSEEMYQDKMILNLYDTHLRYVTNVLAYLQKYRCDSCGRNIRQLIDWNRHQSSCANATEYEYPGGFHKMTPSIFDRLEDFDITVPAEVCLYPWFIVYDFEAILSPINEEQPTPRLKWLRKHKTISVSVTFNVAGFEEAKCFVNSDPKGLIADMMTYMGSITESACTSAEAKWASALVKVEGQLICYTINVGGSVDAEDCDVDVYNEAQKELEALSDEPDRSVGKYLWVFWAPSIIIVDRSPCSGSTAPSMTSTWSSLTSFLGCE